jgi:hypothetical protein
MKLDEETIDIGFRKTTSDKLAWKLEIQKILDLCIRTYGTTAFFKFVERLKKTIYFNVQGYEFRKAIDEKITDLEFDKIVKATYYAIYQPEEWNNPLKRKFREMDIIKVYYDELYDFIIQLIGEKGLLVDTEVYIPIRKASELRDENLPDV